MADPPSSPTWNNLQLGIFVLPVVTAAPTTADGTRQDGTCVLYQNLTTHALTIYAYTRDSGWKSIALS